VFQPGDIVDRTYRVIRKLAFGGAGVTYLVRMMNDEGNEAGPAVALKLLFASRDHGAYLRRLATEAQILQELQHPHIVEYLGFVHRKGQSPYLLTRYEEGGSLLDHMKRVGTMSVRDAASVGVQVCAALAKGHALGITHRDLKPENLLIASSASTGDPPMVRVADFGIAKVEGGFGPNITRVGSFVGTPQYAAPEQFVGEAATPSSDVYSLGSVLVYMMTARAVVPNAHTMAPEDSYAALVEAVPPSILRPTDSAEECAAMNEVLDRAMRLDPRERCSVDAMGTMLENVAAMGALKAGGESAYGRSEGAMQPNEQGVKTAAALTTQSDAWTVQTQPSLPLRSHREPNRSRWLLGMSGLLGLLVIAAALLWWVAPWRLDGLPLVAPMPHENVAGATAAIERAVRQARGEIRKQCPGAKGTTAVLEAVMNEDGSVRWARAEKPDGKAIRCFAGALRGRLSGVELNKPAKARLRIGL